MGVFEKGIFSLYRRCKAWNKLPVEGGVLDQPLELMNLLDAIQEEVDSQNQRKSLEQQTEIMSKEQMRKL